MLPALIRASADGALAVALTWVVCRTMPRMPAWVRAALWWCAAVRFLVAVVWIPPVPLPVLQAERTSPVTLAIAHGDRVATLVEPDSETGGLLSGIARERRALAVVDWPAVLIGAWIGGVALAVVIGIVRWRRAVGLVRRSADAPPWLLEIATDLSCRFRLARAPWLRLSPEVSGPLVVQAPRTCLLLPASCVTRWTRQQWTMAIAHELAHVKRGDLLAGMAPAVTQAVFFFHPLAHAAVREYAMWREAACDVAVLAVVTTEPDAYAALLLDLGISRAPASGITAASRTFRVLKRRLIMLGRNSTSSLSKPLALMSIVAAVTIVVPMRLVARDAPSALDATVQTARTDERLVTNFITSVPAPAPERPTAAQTAPAPVSAAQTPFPVQAPGAQGSVSGSIIDESGARVPGASVTIVSASRTTQVVISSASGQYAFASVPVGTAAITVRLRDFENATREATVAANASTAADVQLRVAGLVETINAVRPSREALRNRTAVIRDDQDFSGLLEAAEMMYLLEDFDRSTDLTTRALTALESRLLPQPPLGSGPPTPPGVVPPAPGRGPARIGGDLKRPGIVHRVMPIYPSSVRGRTTLDVARVSATIGKDGALHRVGAVRYREETVNEVTDAFDRSALAAVSQWIYLPATLNGTPVETPLQVTVHFSAP